MPYQGNRRSFNRTNTNRRPSQSFGGNRGGRPGGRSGGNRGRGPKKAYIHPSKFVREARPVKQEDYIATHQFSDFPVADLLKQNLAKKGYVTPSPIQDQTIPEVLKGLDIVGIANTGTGKTAAFAIPTLNKLMSNQHSKVVIIAPTRELAQQIEVECKDIARGSGLTGAVLIGGSPMGPQLRDLKHNPRVVIGTPGRIKDHLERGTLKLSNFDTVVLDEVDRMLDMGFVQDVTDILSNVAEKRQSLFFSATMDQRVMGIIDKFANQPVTISVKSGETSENVHQDIVAYQTHNDRITQLHDILIDGKVEKVIIFDETQRGVERLNEELLGRGFKTDSIHGGKTQGQRQRALARFKKSEVSILVATDVAARGIDVSGITHVINYSTPGSYDDYIHRIGRAGRAGNVGYALTFVEAR